MPSTEPDKPLTNSTTNDKSQREQEPPLCRVCGVPLLTVAEAKIGVHIRCVFERQHTTTNIPRPRYTR